MPLHLQAAMRASIATLGIKARVKLGLIGSAPATVSGLFTNHRVLLTRLPTLDGFLASPKSSG